MHNIKVIIIGRMSAAKETFWPTKEQLAADLQNNLIITINILLIVIEFQL